MKVINLIPDSALHLWSGDLAEARRSLLAADPVGVLAIDGSFALVAEEGERVVLARSLERPLRYFLAKAADGPVRIVAERIDEIAAELARRGWADQFHPSYTRMAPAHHVTTLRLIGCPDPNPSYRRFFDPPRGTLPPDLDVIGRHYIEAVYTELRRWLAAQDARAPIGVPFSGGIDSGSVLLCLYKLLLDDGQSPARLKAFTLSLDGDGDDARQAREFLRHTNLEMLGETIDVSSSALDPLRAVAVIEDYKPLDVECAAVNLALLEAIRARYPEWQLLVDGDGGDENLKDYPIEANSELTIRSVVNNRMLYQEGWGVDSLKHSLTYSGGYSRGCVRGYACARRHQFVSFSPYTRPAVIAVAEAVPFAELTGGSRERLYALKGEIVSRGVRAVLGLEMPVYPKRRFQHGSATPATAPSCSPPTRRAIAATSTHSTPDERIRGLRPPKPVVDPWTAHGAVVEEERAPGSGAIERALTVFLAGTECPFTCSFCDLWRWTLDGPTPAGALPIQLERVLDEISPPPPFPDRLKLYNASNFFDRRAVPTEDLPRLAKLAEPFAGVTVESHANTIGPMAVEFAALLSGKLEVAVGLETIHPVAIANLNKRLELDRVDRAAAFLTEHGMDLRVFVLLGAPYIAPQEAIEWTVRTVEYAAARGAARIAVIPVRGGNGELERLQALGHFVPPTLTQLESALERCLALGGWPVVTADLWDVERLPACETCRAERVARLARLNLTGLPEPAVRCSRCA